MTVVRRKLLPIGVDIGATRIRMVLLERNAAGKTQLCAAVVREVPAGAVSPVAIAEPDFVAAILDDLRRELGCRQRRCIVALPSSVGIIRVLRFPAMSWSERRRCAHFEAERFAGWDTAEVASAVRIRTVDRRNSMVAVGIARRDALTARVECARRAGMRVVAIDQDALALRRGFPQAEVVLDVGHLQATLHAFSPQGPASERIAGGGLAVTRAIAADLSIDLEMAEQRKRLFGTAGAGEGARVAFATAVAHAVEKLRERQPVKCIALTGNGARLTGLSEAIESGAQAAVELPVSDLLRGGAYPDDVVRAAGPDWTLAAGLAAWSATA